MKRYGVRFRPGLYLLIGILVAMPALARAQDGSRVDPALELQDAAINYEAAATALLSYADELLRSRTPETEDTRERDDARRKNRNAGLEVQASDQLMAAASNLDHASRVWGTAAKVAGDKSAQDYFNSTAKDATRRATALMRRAAELSENAALEFAGLRDQRNQANASHKAGRIREQLAGRR